MVEKERLERLERQKHLDVKKDKDGKLNRSLSQKMVNSKDRKRSTSTSFGENFKKLFRKSDKKKKKAPGFFFFFFSFLFPSFPFSPNCKLKRKSKKKKNPPK